MNARIPDLLQECVRCRRSAPTDRQLATQATSGKTFGHNAFYIYQESHWARSLTGGRGEKKEMSGFKTHLLQYLLVLLTTASLIHRCVDGITVLRFQEDRVASLETTAWYKGHLDPERKLYSVSLCGRFSLFTIHAWATFFMLTNNGKDHILEGDIWVERVRPVFARNWNFQILKEKLWVYRWHHLCFTYDDKNHMIRTYVDGRQTNEQQYDVKRYMAGDRAKLGQGAEAQRSLSGDLTQVNVWDRPLTDDEIRRIANCIVDLQGNYISWDNGWTLQNISSYQTSLATFCQQETGPTYFWFASIPYKTATYLCQSLGSHLPSGTNMTEVWAMLNVSQKIFPTDHSCYRDYWISPNDIDEEGVWKIGKTPLDVNITWALQEPNGLQYENCGSVMHYGVSDVDCFTNSRCVVCTISDHQRASLLGTCEAEIRNVYFTPFQYEKSELVFVGYGEYYITRNNRTWTWVNVVKNTTIAIMEDNEPDFPMGRRWWRLEHTVCEQKPGGRRRLLLSPCPPNHFTCDDATCIPLVQRCDLKYDCRDNTDEMGCHLVSFPKDYQKHLPPRGGNDDEVGLPIVLTVNVEALNIHTMNMNMEVSYRLDLTWTDNRLVYQNLKVNATLNILPMATVKELWAPQVGFVNAIGSHHTLLDGDTTMQVDRHTDTMGRDDAAAEEVELFSGEENALTIYRKYGTVFLCNLDLSLYPFDTQECFMHLKITTAPKNFLVFDSLLSNVTYSASKFLLEYQVGNPYPAYGGKDTYSEVWVRIPLTRRYGYAILNIYLPTLVLLIVSYITLFFRPKIFDTRMMAALTVQLVIATLFSQVSSSLPKTAYFKMVDVWLIFCIGITFLTIIFHLVVDIVVNKSQGDHPGVFRCTPLANQVNVQEANATKTTDTKNNNNTRRKSTCNLLAKYSNNSVDKNVVLFTKLAVPTVFFFFNVIYWPYILTH
ncbi:hypothetical protein Pmani_014362 [Petrolisthes manimaculis]|uniref:Pentraxin (PTX) domain-containing protein n=1 Tax=Petrolisthes manimaculis TaxID=1843537 RepID=A0AAE1UCP7_9EUCA|nr:hypothetical protein Pmani_014362 [Petrolisthes manimaculis]